MNKFNLAWQLVRLHARAIKDPEAKVKFVLGFLSDYPSIHNYARVYNWLRMTSLGYIEAERRPFEAATEYLETHKADYSNKEDHEVNWAEVSTDELQQLKDDLDKRKYNFQFGSTPKAHIEFVEKLDKELGKRNG